eukprot:10969776-Lingulodinium_polyedra.AAC.1
MRRAGIWGHWHIGRLTTRNSGAPAFWGATDCGAKKHRALLGLLAASCLHCLPGFCRTLVAAASQSF